MISAEYKVACHGLRRIVDNRLTTLQMPRSPPPPPPPHYHRHHAHAPGPPPPMVHHQPFQLPPPPPFQHPYAQPLVGHAPAAPVGSQFHDNHISGLPVNAPQGFAQHYGAPFYPPYAPVGPIQYPHFGPGPGQLQPWDYTRHFMGRMLGPVTPTHVPPEAGGPVVEDTRTLSGMHGPTAAPPTQVVPTKKYPNKLIAEGGTWYSSWLGSLTLMTSSLAVYG